MQHYRRYAFPSLANFAEGVRLAVAAAPASPSPSAELDSRAMDEALQAASEAG